MDALKFKPHVQALVEKTQLYWTISKSYNGHSEGTLTTGHALSGLSSVLRKCDPARPIYSQAGDLQYTIITGGAKNAKAV